MQRYFLKPSDFTTLKSNRLYQQTKTSNNNCNSTYCHVLLQLYFHNDQFKQKLLL